MKLKHLAVLSLTAAAAFATSAMAADPTVTFKGEVVGSACTPRIDGSDSGEVQLKKIIESMLPSQSKTAGETEFHINLTACSMALNGKVVKAYFYQAGAQHGRLVKTSGSGSGWSYQLLNKAGNKILPVGTGNAGIVDNPDDGGIKIMNNAGTLTYKVRYYRESENLMSGTLNALANYVVYHN